jgi:signal transduction histidine kinase
MTRSPVWARLGSRTLAVATVAMAVLLVALAVLQYRWVGQVSDAERERLRRGLETAADHIADDFDREVFRAFVAFAPTRRTGAGLVERLADGWDRWRASALDPELIADVFVLAPAHDDSRAEAALARLDVEARSLVPSDWPPELVALDERLDLARASRHSPTSRPRGPRPLPLIVSAPALLLLPVWTTPPGRLGRHDDGTIESADAAGPGSEIVIVLFDRERIAGTLLPELLDQHLGPEPRETEVWVLDRTRRGRPVFATSPPPERPDQPEDRVAVRDLLALRSFPELRAQGFAHFFDDPDAGGPLDEARARRGSEPSSRGRRGGGEPSPRPRGWQRAPSMARSAIAGAPEQGPWTLVVARSEGSLEAAVARLRRRNLGIGLAVVALLGATAAMLLASARQVQRLARREMELVAGITHELRTPLAAIGSAADNLADGVVAAPEQIRRYGSLIRSETNRLGSLVAQVLDFAGTAATGRRARPVEAVELGGVVDRVLADHHWAIEEKGFTVERREAPDLPPVLADREALRRAIDNVVGNAIKYGATGRWLGIEAGMVGGAGEVRHAATRDGVARGAVRSAEPRVALRVRDRGPGVARGDRRRIFEPFYRGAGAAAHLHGTGLGLAVTRSVLESFGGTIDVEDGAPQEGRASGGASFLITLPAALRPAAVHRDDASPHEVPT